MAAGEDTATSSGSIDLDFHLFPLTPSPFLILKRVPSRLPQFSCLLFYLNPRSTPPPPPPPPPHLNLSGSDSPNSRHTFSHLLCILKSYKVFKCSYHSHRDEAGWVDGMIVGMSASIPSLHRHRFTKTSQQSTCTLVSSPLQPHKPNTCGAP